MNKLVIGKFPARNLFPSIGCRYAYLVGEMDRQVIRVAAEHMKTQPRVTLVIKNEERARVGDQHEHADVKFFAFQQQRIHNVSGTNLHQVRNHQCHYRIISFQTKITFQNYY